MIKKIRRELIEKKLADTKKFLDFLNDFKEKPNNYRRIVIETIFTGLDNGSFRDEEKCDYNSDTIKKYSDFIWINIASLIVYKINDCWKNDIAICFCFYNSDDKKFAWLTCIKN